MARPRNSPETRRQDSGARLSWRLTGDPMDSGSIAWVLGAAALVLFMTPGLALFYGGMDRSRNVLNMLMMNFWCLLTLPLLWVIVGCAPSSYPFENDFLGNFDQAFLRDINLTDGTGTIAAIAFLGMFAVITPAL